MASSVGYLLVIFGPHHYVPVLKVKRGEKRALALMPPYARSKITPLLEIVERSDKDLERHLQTAFEGLAGAVNGYNRCFIDTRELESDGEQAARTVFQEATAQGISFTPVTGLSRTADVSAGLEYGASRGIALRLLRSEFESGGLDARLTGFLQQNGLVPQDIDLIVDLSAVDNMVSAGVEALSTAFLAAIPDHSEWKTFTLLACAFPMSMAIVNSQSFDFAERSEWLAWRDGLYTRRAAMARLPTYGDGAIQHPIGVEGFDPRIMQVSAAIRYTTDDSWLLVKGQSTRLLAPSVQFPALARRLVYEDLQSNYRGRNHCPACWSIQEAADGAFGFGSAEAWRRLGTLHHMATVVIDLGALTWP